MDTLYHYCSPTALVSMITTQSIWLSSVTLSNDSMEGKVVRDTFSRIFKREALELGVTKELQDAIAVLENSLDGLGFCLSEAGDLLSQWRGYATDGQGFSVGFSRKYLEELSKQVSSDESRFKLYQVVYDQHEQEQQLMPIYNEIKKQIDEGNLKFPKYPSILSGGTEDDFNRDVEKYGNSLRTMFCSILKSFPQLFFFKNSAFVEEKEWRLISFMGKTSDKCKFRAVEACVIPYQQIELRKIDVPPIAEVIIGPKNRTPEYVVKSLLSQNGCPNVVVKQSSATYR